jgi:hypothetical protein
LELLDHFEPVTEVKIPVARRGSLKVSRHPLAIATLEDGLHQQRTYALVLPSRLYSQDEQVIVRIMGMLGA